MIREYPTEWTSNDLAPAVDPMSSEASWETLDQQQRKNFLDEKDWRQIRQEAQGANPGSRGSTGWRAVFKMK